jgi:hypothetical protein
MVDTPGPDERRPAAGGMLGARRMLLSAQVAVVALIVLACMAYSVAYVRGWYDDTCYHIVNAVRIAKSLNPYYVDSPVDSHWFPAAASTVMAVLVRLSGSIEVTNLSGAGCLLIMLAVLWRFSGLWSHDAGARFSTLICAATIPLLMGQCLAFYIDIHMALVMVAGIYLLARSIASSNGQYAYYGLAVLCLAPGLKYSGVLFLLISLPFCAWAVWAARSNRRPRVPALAALIGTSAFAGGWYLRNWLQRGNPFFPFAWGRHVVEWFGRPYQYNPEHYFISPRATGLHPFIPEHWLRHLYAPDMTEDGFGASFVLAAGMCLLTLPLLSRFEPRQRQAWVFVLAATGAFVAATPLGWAVPRYILFVPVLVCLGPAVLVQALRTAAARKLARGLVLGILAFGVAYAGNNVIDPRATKSGIASAAKQLFPYKPVAITTYSYVAAGHLRIGYLSGSDNFIAALYDSHMTNELIPLHYRNFPYHYGREYASPEEFAEYVRGLNLDYIHCFDERNPATNLLRAAFPEKMAPGR